MLEYRNNWLFTPLNESKFGESLRELGFDVGSLHTSFFVLDRESLAAFWTLSFGNDGRKRRIPDDWWGFKCHSRNLDIEWHDYCDVVQANRVKLALENSIAFASDDPVCFFRGIEVIATRWKPFLEHWNAFYDLNDEGICCAATKAEGLCFSPLNSIACFRG